MTGIGGGTDTKIPKKILTPENGLKLRDLDGQEGDLVGFDNSDTDPPQPFIITRVGESGLMRFNREYAEKLKETKTDPFYKSLLLIHSGQDSLKEAYFLDVSGKVREIWAPHYDEHDVKPNIKKVDLNRYVFDSAYVGRVNVINALKERKFNGLDFYADYLESFWGRLTIRGR